MIKRIQKTDPRHYPDKLKYTTVYTVHDEDDSGEFGFIGLNTDGEVHFKITEEVFLDTASICIICEFMDRMKKIAANEEIDTLGTVYYYNHERARG